MPAVRSFYVLSILAACLAQAWAGDYNGGGGGGDTGGQGQGGSGQGGSWSDWGGGSGGGSGGGGGNKDYNNNQYQTSTVWENSVVTVAAPTTIVQAEAVPPVTSTLTETTTITAVSPCTASVVTAYVTQWMNAPPGCWCGAAPSWVTALATAGGALGLLDNAPVFTSTNPAFTPGLSSIPASEAVQTGVTVAAVAAAPAPTATPAASPAGFFTDSSSSVATPATSGTDTPGPSSVTSNVSKPSKTGEAPKSEVSTSTTTSAAASSTTAATSSPSPSSSTSSSASAAAVSASAPTSASATDSGFPVGSFKTLDPATLTLKNAYTLGIGKRAPVPTLIS